MKTYELVILTLSYSDRGMIAGRTLLQKTLYFLNEKLGLGIDFIPYYYGPYSAEVTEVISSLKATGVVEEKVETFSSFNFNVTFEPRRYIETSEKLARFCPSFSNKKFFENKVIEKGHFSFTFL